MRILVAREHRRPFLAQRPAAVGNRLVEGLRHTVGHEEVLVRVPAIGFFGGADVILAQRLAMRLGGAGARGAPADHRMHNDQRRPIVGLAKRLECLGQRGAIIGVVDMDDVPAIALETLADVLVEGEIGAALDRDVVAVVDPAQIGELEVPRQARRLGRHAFHQIAVAAQRIDVVIEDREIGFVVMRRQPALGDRHAHRIAAPLPQRAGRRLHARGVAIFGMPRRLRSELPEILDVLQAHRGLAGRLAVPINLFDAGEVQQRVEQHRGMADREHEAVAIGPIRFVGIGAEKLAP